MRLELDGITAVHLAQVFMGPQISHIGGCTGLDAEVLDEIDAVNVGLVLPVEKTYDIVAVRELSNPTGTVFGTYVAAQWLTHEAGIVQFYKFLVLINLKGVPYGVVLVSNCKC